MLVVHADVFAQIPERQAVREALVLAQAAAREQDGCISFLFAEVVDDPGHFVSVETWRDSAALDAHYASQSYSRYRDAVTLLLVRDSEARVYAAEELARPLDPEPLDLRQDD